MVLFRKKKEYDVPEISIQLTIIEGNNDVGDSPGKVFQLACGNNFIGRDSLCEVFLNSGTVSRRHANLKVGYDKKTFSITDLGSANGVLIKPDILLRNKKSSLTSGDEFHIGEILFKFLVIEEQQSNLTMSVDVQNLLKETRRVKRNTGKRK
ncbi:MAG: FHA domain-containing protein [Candidatus Aminicenantes bacterium]|nr:FHA domain-containing protein [Candidatus Aminicenantes bacterium]